MKVAFEVIGETMHYPSTITPIAFGEVRGLLEAFAWFNNKVNYSPTFTFEELPKPATAEAALEHHLGQQGQRIINISPATITGPGISVLTLPQAQARLSMPPTAALLRWRKVDITMAMVM